MQKQICHDCGCELKMNDEYMSYVMESGEYCKCKSCHEADPMLRNFQKTEVYSRVVGYIRPVAQWNGGKQAEFDDRKEFKVGDAACVC
ncbi:MAG: anaerobic ribonucleoside-triphosphate reductase [Candidatus Moraniibacteriota bacterium]|jgi:anaerobic ribonucleoside-triphosphate reductase